MMGLEFTVVPSDFEEWLDDTQTPQEVAVELGLGKARAVAERYPEAIVIGGDTIVTIEGNQLGKASTIEEARAMLRSLAGKSHTVTTSVAVVCLAEEYEYVAADETEVFLKAYNEQAAEKYLATGDWHDKAGAYGIQSGAGPLVDHFEGDIETIIGLPTRLLVDPLAHLEVSAQKAGYKL
jgi:septum formation protein